MSWMHTQMKPEKRCDENPVFPASKIFEDIDWKLSGGTKHACLISAAMILAYNIRTVVEIGLWNGFTSHILGKALSSNAMEDGLLVSCDINQRACDRSIQFTKDLPIQHTLITADSKKVKWEEYLGDRKIGLGFVDGDHSYESAMYDMIKVSDLLDRNGIMVVHDYSAGAHPWVFKAVNEFAAYHVMPWFFLPENRITTDYRTAIFQNREVY